MKIYQVSGLGANEKAFKYLKINPEFETVYIPWLQPEELETLGNYAERMAAKIDTSEEFILMGLSFGGIIVQEMNRFLHPKLNILISTVKSREELPLFMKFSSKTNLRSEERRVGKECRSRWWRYHSKKKEEKDIEE